MFAMHLYNLKKVKIKQYRKKGIGNNLKELRKLGSGKICGKMKQVKQLFWLFHLSVHDLMNPCFLTQGPVQLPAEIQNPH